MTRTAATAGAETRMDRTVRTVGVLMGGCSKERAISLQTGRAIADALGRAGCDVRPTDVRPGQVTRDLVDGLDVVFLAFHGTWGEDGGVQTELEALGALYTGCGPEASRLAMDKPAAKARFLEAGVPTPAFRIASRGDEAALAEALETLGPKLVAKPTAEGSSIGIHMCTGLAALRHGAEAVWADHEAVLIERRIEGRELTVGILGETPLPVTEIVPPKPGRWFDFENKYHADCARFDHDLSPEVERHVAETALAAHRTLGCRDLSRVDLMLTAEGEPRVLEVNTIPGFTDHSLVPKAAERAGLSFARLCERIVELAWARRTETG